MFESCPKCATPVVSVATTNTNYVVETPTPGKNLTQLTDNIFAVEIPEDAIYTRVFKDSSGEYLSGFQEPLIPLPPGSYTLLFLSKEATEDDWKKVCDSDVGGGEIDEKIWLEWFNYETDEYSFDTATESGYSLLRSKGLDPTKQYTIIKNNQL